MDVSKNRGTPKSSISIGFSIINHPFWGYPYSWKHPYEVAPQGLGVAKEDSLMYPTPPPLEKWSFAKSVEHRRSCRPPASTWVEGIGGGVMSQDQCVTLML